MSLQSVLFFCKGFVCATEILNTRQRLSIDMESPTSLFVYSSSTGMETNSPTRPLNYFT